MTIRSAEAKNQETAPFRDRDRCEAQRVAQSRHVHRANMQRLRDDHPEDQQRIGEQALPKDGVMLRAAV
jgi:hypothetical protein